MPQYVQDIVLSSAWPELYRAADHCICSQLYSKFTDFCILFTASIKFIKTESLNAGAKHVRRNQHPRPEHNYCFIC